MTYEEAKTLTMDLRTRFDAPFSSHDKAQIEVLYNEVLGKTFYPTSCQNCYHDALIEICLYLKKHTTMAEKCNYKLRAGFIINCPSFKQGQIFTNDNLTDDVAAAYLKQFPNMADMFQAIPKKSAKESPKKSAKESPQKAVRATETNEESNVKPNTNEAVTAENDKK